MSGKSILLAIGAVMGGAIFAIMGYCMWMMMGAMGRMSTDMAAMRDYMLLMGGDRQQVKAFVEKKDAELDKGEKPARGTATVASPTCDAYLANLEMGGTSATDDISPQEQRYESYMAAMRRDIGEMDRHIFCMYLSMSADMRAMRYSMGAMTPSVASMGPTMNYMGRDMNRGVNSFSNPMNYMFNAFR